MKKLTKPTILLMMLWNVAAFASPSDQISTKQRVNDYEKPHVGVLLGVTSPEGAYQNSAEVGLNFGFEAALPFSLGLELSNAKNQTRNEFDKLQRTKLLVTGAYNFSESIPLLSTTYIGAGIGPSLESTTNDDELAWIFMPYAGFDVPFLLKSNAMWSAGLNARYLISSTGQPNSTSLLFVTKYWF